MFPIIRYTLYFLFFIILTEHLSWESAVAALFALALSQMFIPTLRTANSRLGELPLLFMLWAEFLCVLVREIVLANLQVAKILLTPSMPIAPHVSCYTTQLKNHALLAVFSTAITLTPGTMTIDICDSTLRIHCLTPAYRAALDHNPLEILLLRIEEVLHA